MPRAQNAHAIVNAGFLFKLNKGAVEDCTIVYGSINPKFVRATKTENVLKGRQLYNNATLKVAYKSLDQEIVCDSVLPEPSPEYRKNLAISLFYKVKIQFFILPNNYTNTNNAFYNVAIVFFC